MKEALGLTKKVLKIAKKSLKFLKKVASKWEFWLVILAILLIVLLVIYIRKRRAKKVGAAPKTGEKHLASSSLWKVWKAFLREIPSSFRRSIMLYQHFVVIGEAGSGKGRLIDNCTDWKGQSYQFYPSYTLNPLLKIYLGSKALIQEIPAALLNDTSKYARNALIKLWRPLFKKKEPTMVVVLNAASLQTDTPELIKKEAQIARGKINLLSRIRKKPLKVCIALTNMKKLTGYLEFSNFLRQNNISLNLEFKEKKDLQNLKTCLEPYEAYLPNALTTIKTQDYLKIISFFRQSTELFSVLSVFVKILQAPDPLSFEPEIVRLCLTSQEEPDAVSNPFISAITQKDFSGLTSLDKHRHMAAAMVVFGLLYLGGGYLYGRHFLQKTDRELDAMEQDPPLEYGEEIHDLFLDFSSSLEKDPLLTFLPNYFPDVTQKIHQRLLDDIRKFYLIPELELLESEANAQEKKLYLLALLYASNNNDLGKLILGNIVKWAENLDLPETLVRDYIKYHDTSWNIPVNLGGLASHGTLTPAKDVQPWMVFFHEIEKTYKKTFITKIYLKELKSKADRLLRFIGQANRYNLSVKVYELLKRESPLDIETEWVQKPGRLRLGQESIRDFLLFLKGHDMSYPLADELSLGQCLENIRTMISVSNQKERKFQFYIDTKKFVFSAKQFHKLIDNSRITFFLRDFISKNKRYDGLLFFQNEREFEDLEMNPGNKGLFFFTGKGKIDGRYTKNAFEQKIKPVLLELPEFIKKLPVKEAEKKRFSDFVFKEVEAYAERYVSEFQNYYHQFGLKASSLGELRLILTQMQLPSSPFQEFLQIIKENTNIDANDIIYFRPFINKLKVFNFVQLLMEERKGALPELDNYKMILEQFQGDLELLSTGPKEEDPSKPKEKENESNELKELLSPLGKASLAVFRDEKDSYLNLVKMWLKNVGITSQWQKPFLEPIHQAYPLGLLEVEDNVNKIWDDLWITNIQPLVTKFPFDKNAEAEIAQAELEAAINPQGLFWKTFHDFLSPVCQRHGNEWYQRTPPLKSFKFPSGMVDTINQMEHITKTLWDDKGNQLPVMFTIKTHPFPKIKSDVQVVVLSYLRAGGTSVFGFNQTPSWQKFPFEWWKSQSAAVGVEIVTSDESTKSYKEIAVSESPWSFYRLLNKARIFEANILTWEIGTKKTKKYANIPETIPVELRKTKSEDKGVEVQFSIKKDPWSMFQLPQ